MTLTPAPPRAPRRESAGPVRPSPGPSFALIPLVGLVALAVCVVLSLALGAATLDPGEVLRALAGGGTEQVRAVVDARLGRTLVGMLVGAAVALSGAVLQGVTRNPLADPGVLGVNAGASLAVVLGIHLAGVAGLRSFVLLALLGSVVAAAVVHLVAQLAPASSRPLSMTLAGAAVSAAATSVVGAVMVIDQATLESFRGWQVGSVAGRDPGALGPALPLLAVGAVVCLLSGPALNTLALGDDTARALGRRVETTRLVAAGGALALAAGATAIAGPVGFVGLVVPHVVRLLVGVDQRRVLLGCLLGGPVLVVLADTAGRLLARPAEVPVGIVTALVGVPVLVVLVRRLRGSR